LVSLITSNKNARTIAAVQDFQGRFVSSVAPLFSVPSEVACRAISQEEEHCVHYLVDQRRIDLPNGHAPIVLIDKEVDKLFSIQAELGT
jgi:hypothetical protein